MSMGRVPRHVNGFWLATADLTRDERKAIAVALVLREADMIQYTLRQVAALTGIAEREIRNAVADFTQK